MRITVSDARSFAKALSDGADAAEQAGQTDFDLTGELEQRYSAALAEAKEAISEARSEQSGS